MFGGGLQGSVANSVSVDSSGNILLAGFTYAGDFPVVDAAQDALKGTQDGFVAKINSAGTGLIYSTYLGGSSIDQLNAIAVDSTGSAWTTGSSSSADFPVLNATQSTIGGVGSAVVVVKIDENGVLKFSTYLGNGITTGYGIAVDESGSAYVTGVSNGLFPITPGAMPFPGSAINAFATKYSSTGSFLYSTLLGGGGGISMEGRAIAVDSSGNAYLTGEHLQHHHHWRSAWGSPTRK